MVGAGVVGLSIDDACTGGCAGRGWDERYEPLVGRGEGDIDDAQALELVGDADEEGGSVSSIGFLREGELMEEVVGEEEASLLVIAVVTEYGLADDFEGVGTKNGSKVGGHEGIRRRVGRERHLGASLRAWMRFNWAVDMVVCVGLREDLLNLRLQQGFVSVGKPNVELLWSKFLSWPLVVGPGRFG